MCKMKHPSSSAKWTLREAVKSQRTEVVKAPLEEDWVQQMIVGVARGRLQAAAEVQVISGE